MKAVIEVKGAESWENPLPETGLAHALQGGFFFKTV